VETELREHKLIVRFIAGEYGQGPTMTSNTASGWTLMELLVAIVMVSILSALAIPTMTPMLESMKLRTAALNVQRTLVAARTRAITDPNVHCGVYFPDSMNAYIFPDSASGTAYQVDARDTANIYLGRYKLPKKIYLCSLSTSLTNRCIVFRGDGSAKYGGNIYIFNKYNKKRTINVLATTGRIKVR
jgi:prepilin-type N-terminal cleavage/methylation domain-containing protein